MLLCTRFGMADLSQCAYWVQAIGSILAIFSSVCLAVGVAYWQHRQNLEAQRAATKAADARALAAPYAFGLNALKLYESAYSTWLNRGSGDADSRNGLARMALLLSEADEELKQFVRVEPASLPSEATIQSFRTLVKLFRESQRALTDLRQQSADRFLDRAIQDELATAAERATDAAATEFSAFRKLDPTYVPK